MALEGLRLRDWAVWRGRGAAEERRSVRSFRLEEYGVEREPAEDGMGERGALGSMRSLADDE